MDGFLEKEILRKLYDVISHNPGLHLSKIAELLQMSIPLTDYHLLSMSRNDEILAVKDVRGYYKRYYVKEAGPASEETKILQVLMKKVPLQIVLLLLRSCPLQHKDLLKEVPIGSSTLSYYLGF